MRNSKYAGRRYTIMEGCRKRGKKERKERRDSGLEGYTKGMDSGLKGFRIKGI